LHVTIVPELVFFALFACTDVQVYNNNNNNNNNNILNISQMLYSLWFQKLNVSSA